MGGFGWGGFGANAGDCAEGVCGMSGCTGVFWGNYWPGGRILNRINAEKPFKINGNYISHIGRLVYFDGGF
jgi:hypothetical protein